MLESSFEKEKVDVTVVVDTLKRKEELESIGGMAYIVTLMDSAPLSICVEDHVRIIRRCSVKRLAIEKASEIIEVALKDDIDLDIFLAEMDNSLSEVKEKAAEGVKKEKFEVSFDNLFSSNVTETPFEHLNNLITGFGSEELVLIGGRQGSGKTALCLRQIRHTVMEKGQGIIYCGAHMDETRIYLRLIAQMTGLKFKDLNRGSKLLETKAKEINEAIELIRSKQSLIQSIVINKKIELSQLQTLIGSAVRGMETEPRFVFIENLQQLSWHGKNFRGNVFAESNFMIEKIKSWGLKMPFTLVVSSQLTRKSGEGEDKRPQIGHILSDEAEHLPEVILFPFRPNYYEKRNIKDAGRPEHDAELILAKGGPPLILPMTFWGDSLNWEEREVG